MASTSPEVQGHLCAGLRELRHGKVSAALEAWDEALRLDPHCEDARAFGDYVRENRIRIAVHLGRTLPQDHVHMELPQSWPPPPARFCDPLPREADEAPTAASPELHVPNLEAKGDTTVPELGQEPGAEVASEPKSSLDPEAEPYQILEIEEGEDGSEATGDFQKSPSSEYVVLEIVMDDEEEAMELSGELPPPPEAMDAPEMVLEAPSVERILAEDPADYLVVRADTGDIESIGLEHLAGHVSPEVGEGSEAQEAESLAVRFPAYAEDAPTIARDPEGSPPRAFPAQDAPKEGYLAAGPSPGQPPVAPGGPEARVPLGATPRGTLMGIGMPSHRDRGLMPHFGQGVPKAASHGHPPAGTTSPPFVDTDPVPRTPRPRGPILPPGEPVSQADRVEDYVASEGSFSEDIPTRMRARQDSGPMGKALIRPLPKERSDDYVASEGSFSDDLPTRTRDHASTSQQPLAAPPLPKTQATNDTESMGRSEPAGDASGQVNFSDTSDDPEKGLALCRTLLDEGAHQRCMDLLERLETLHGALPGLDELLEQCQQALEATLLESLGPLDAIVIPRMPQGHLADLDLDPRAAFLFTRIDGTLSLEDLLDVSGMSRFETTRLLVKLRDLGLLGFEPDR